MLEGCVSFELSNLPVQVGSSAIGETAKDVTFFIGSVLGILAFLNTLIQPAFVDNRQKWEALKERLTEYEHR